MKISLNAIKEIYKQVGVESFLPDDIADVTERIGSQLGEIEEVVDLSKKYGDALIAKVVSCVDHPNADKLSICRIDDGGKNKDAARDKEGLVQVVCGAPNVRAGMSVVWLPPGATVPSTYDKEPFTLEARGIRGVVSNGMLASANELGINDDHTGILEVDKQANPGDSFAHIYKLDDYIIDIENKMFTHRPDCFGLLGIAREVAGIYNKQFKSPDWYKEEAAGGKRQAASDDLSLEIINEIPKLTPRFCAVAIRDVKIAPSPVWLQVFLAKVGVKSVNNIVDYTNFLMHFSGQPLHAYDYDKVAKLSGKGAVLKVRLSQSNEKIKLLNGKEIVPAKGTIMIATNKHAIGLGGVIGGKSTEVDDNTKNIIIECANFDPYSIRCTSMTHGIFTDAVTRFTKGQSPRQTLAVITKAASDLTYLSGGKLASDIIDVKHDLKVAKPVRTDTEFINSRLGLKLSGHDISSILEKVEFAVSTKGAGLEVSAPFWRTDIEIAEDIVEEVGRLYGYDKLPQTLPKKTMSPSIVSDELKLKQQLREILSSLGANELMNYSFVHSDLLRAAGEDEAKSYKLKNALSPDLQYYRQSLTPSLLEKVHPNIKLGFGNFALFELGKVHVKGEETDGLPAEFSRLALVVADKKSSGQSAYYSARKYLVDLLATLNISQADIEFETIGQAHDYYLKGRSAIVKLEGRQIGTIGEYAARTVGKLKLPSFCAGFEIGLELLNSLSAPKSSYKPLSRYPSTVQDITLKTDNKLNYARIAKVLSESLENNSPDDVNVDAECLDIFAKDYQHKNTSFRLSMSSYQRTLTTEVANKLLEKTAEELQAKIKAERV